VGIYFVSWCVVGSPSFPLARREAKPMERRDHPQSSNQLVNLNQLKVDESTQSESMSWRAEQKAREPFYYGNYGSGVKNYLWFRFHIVKKFGADLGRK
jgi:hypothetical protein